MKNFCKDIGLDKKTLLTMLLGENHNTSKKDHQSSQSKDIGLTLKDHGGVVNTGAAAQLAYNNIISNDSDIICLKNNSFPHSGFAVGSLP